MKFRKHLSKWKDCKACWLHKGRQRVVFARGNIPAPILFVGEAPGDSEDVIGQPFVGPAGIHPACGLDSMINQAIHQQSNCKYCITNIVGCIPRVPSGEKLGAPDNESIQACRPKIQELIKLCRPKLIICVGDVAWEECPRLDYGEVEYIKIIHPAHILRSHIGQRGILVQRNVVIITDAIEKVLGS